MPSKRERNNQAHLPGPLPEFEVAQKKTSGSRASLRFTTSDLLPQGIFSKLRVSLVNLAPFAGVDFNIMCTL
jgi:hypothetical protein